MSDIVEYKPGTPFPGIIGRTLDELSPAWPLRDWRPHAGLAI